MKNGIYVPLWFNDFGGCQFGLRNAPGTFKRAIDIILYDIKWKTCLVYLDDVEIFSSSRDMHLKHVMRP
jgi:hypothetical protein